MPSIKNKPSLLLPLVVLVGGMFLVGINQVQAVGDAFFPEDTTVRLEENNYIIAANSDADTVETTNLAITITISTGQSFTFKSAARKSLNVNGNYTSKSCSTAESSVLIAPVAGDSQRTVVITPDSSTNCIDTSIVAGGGGGGGGGGTTIAVATPTPTSAPTPTFISVPQITTTPPSVSVGRPTPTSRGFSSLTILKLRDGDVISAAGSSDPDVYIVNPHGYKRLFLNPEIFKFYGHLGGFSKVKGTTPAVRETFVTSGLFRNCETNDKKVYGVETTGEDIGKLHWINTTGDQAVKDDPDFFKKVFCINTKEFNWYPQGVAYTSVNQIPNYSRTNAVSVSKDKKYKVFDTTQLNVRALANTSSAILGKIPGGQIIESLGQQGLWHKIKYQSKDGWVHNNYLKAI